MEILTTFSIFISILMMIFSFLVRTRLIYPFLVTVLFVYSISDEILMFHIFKEHTELSYKVFLILSFVPILRSVYRFLKRMCRSIGSKIRYRKG